MIIYSCFPPAKSFPRASSNSSSEATEIFSLSPSSFSSSPPMSPEIIMKINNENCIIKNGVGGYLLHLGHYLIVFLVWVF